MRIADVPWGSGERKMAAKSDAERRALKKKLLTPIEAGRSRLQEKVGDEQEVGSPPAIMPEKRRKTNRVVCVRRPLIPRKRN